VATSSNADAQDAVLWGRLRQLFTARETPGDEPPRRGLTITVCVLLSLVIWLALTLQEEMTVTLDVPTRVVNVPDGQALAALPPETVRVQVSGQRRQLLWLYLNTPPVPIDATSREVSVQGALNLPETNLTVNSVTPQRVDVATEEKIYRQLPVRSRVQVDLPPSYEMLRPPRVVPDSVVVAGARSLVGGLQAWPTEAVAIENPADTICTSVPLADTLTALVERDTDAVTYQAEMGRFTEARREVEVEVTGIPSDRSLVALEPSVVEVRYRVLFDQLFQSRDASDFFATVSYSQIRSDTTGYVQPNVHVPSDLYIRDPEPYPPRLRYYTFMSSE